MHFLPKSSATLGSLRLSHASNVPISGSLVVMDVTWQTTYLRRVCARTATPCVSSAWDQGPGTAPHAEMQGES